MPRRALVVPSGFVLAQRLSMPVDGAAPPSSVDAQVAASLLHAAQAHAQALLAAAAVQALAFVGVAVGAQALAWLLQSHPSSSTAPAPSTSAPSTSTSTPAPAPSPPAPRKEDLSPALGAPLASLYQRASDLTTDRDAKVRGMRGAPSFRAQGVHAEGPGGRWCTWAGAGGVARHQRRRAAGVELGRATLARRAP